MSKDSKLTRTCPVMVQKRTCTCDILCKTVDTAPSAPLHSPQVPEAVNHKITINIRLLIGKEQSSSSILPLRRTTAWRETHYFLGKSLPYMYLLPEHRRIIKLGELHGCKIAKTAGVELEFHKFAVISSRESQCAWMRRIRNTIIGYWFE